jgi:histidine ammonia-lyase
MGMTAALKLRTIVDHLEIVLASELLAACQAMEFRKPLVPGLGTRMAYQAVREAVPPLDTDREISPDVRAVADLVRRGTFSEILAEM